MRKKYEKTDWKARKGTNLNRFEKSQESSKSVILENAPTSVTEPGTSFSVDNMNKIEQGICDAYETIVEEEQARMDGDKGTLATAKNYTDEVADQEVADRNTAISEHDESDSSHRGIRRKLADESQERQTADQDLQNQIISESQARVQGNETALNAAISYADQKAEALCATLDGAQAVALSGALLTRIINGTTPVARNLFDPSTVFVADKTIISDINGTIGVCREQDSATVTVETLSVSPVSPNEPTLLGNVATFANLPQTAQDAVELGWNTPKIDDYARVLRDETNEDKTVEWYIGGIEDGIIAWANPVVINTSDYQAQTTAQDSGRVLTGGAAAGTFGESLPVDNAPTENSNNLINSGALYRLMKDVFLLSHPIGSIYMTAAADEDTAVKVQNKYGGTWEAWGKGRVPVGVDGAHVEFNTVEKTGGEKAHVLTAGETGEHTHTYSGTSGSISANHTHNFNHYHTTEPHTHALVYGIHKTIQGGRYGHPSSGAWTFDEVSGDMGLAQPRTYYLSEMGAPQETGYASSDHAHNYSGTTAKSGSGAAHNNLQPYITCYMYKRTA